MRLPILSVSAIDLNSGGSDYSAPLAVQAGADVTKELNRLLRCMESYEGSPEECCLIGEICVSDKTGSGAVSKDNNTSSNTIKCPPATFSMCVAQGWLCRHRPRVIWDR
jgi:hypothetical protein